ncbi:hypothetical protein CBR_g34784 [Chara braunii]|uniref:HAT C-terminal dimerisation domain-containing protein n=1 Tax=Chara braunii TaxID=69332 RepID=A0A388LJB6_CHABU|nr:hypothetical protein CBR_g34784 [Chara braunii]|eukprot:GBG82408.1 hypothetical protein CBR_g34784 [Chara braunii]
MACSDHKIATVLTTVFNKTTITTDGVRSAPFYKYHKYAPHLFEMIDNSKELVRYFKQANLQNYLSKTLKQENATRWNSLLISLNNILDSYDDVTIVLARLANTNRQANKQFLITRIDKNSLAELARFLKRFQTATLGLEKHLEPTLHLVAFERSALLEYCKPRNEPYNDEEADGKKFTIPSDSDDIIAVKMLTKHVLQEKWILDDLHIAAALLDPRQKHRLDRFRLLKTQVERGTSCLQEIMHSVKDTSAEASEETAATEGRWPLKRRMKTPTREVADELTLCSTDEDEEEDLPIARIRPLTQAQRIRKELELYFSLKLTKEEKKKFDILVWWKAKGTLAKNPEDQLLLPPLPIMARAARAVLCVPASSLKSECNFSNVGNTVTKKRNQLNRSVVDDVLFVRSNCDVVT